MRGEIRVKETREKRFFHKKKILQKRYKKARKLQLSHDS
jgi:hypothetical protein